MADQMFNSLYNWCVKNGRSDLLDEWDYLKNAGVTPKTISYGTDKKVWWIKPYDDPKTGKHFDFSWEASVSHRKDGRGCPYLSTPAKKIYIGFNDLSSTHPKLAKEWVKHKNSSELKVEITDVTYGSTKKVYWNCEIHGIYKARISARTHGNGCPYCAGKKVLAESNDLKTTNPEIASEWDYNKNGCGPETVTKGCITKYWWKCKNGHSFLQTPNSRTSNGTGCPFCNNKRILFGYNDFKTLYPHFADEWNYDKNGELMPEHVAPKSNRKVWWKCRLGHEYETKIYSKVLYNTGCPICNSERETSFPEQTILFYTKKYFNAKNRIHFEWLGNSEIDIYIPELKVGIEYDGDHWHKDLKKDLKKDKLCKENGVDLIRIRDKQCPDYDSFSKKIYIEKHKSIEIAISEMFNYINKKYSMNLIPDININRDYSSITDSFVFGIKENNLADGRPDLSKEWNYNKNGNVKPNMISLYSNKKVWWTCPVCGYEYLMSVNNRTGSKHSNCPVCAGKKVVTGLNDLSTTHPELLKEWDFSKNAVSPNSLVAGTHKKVWWLCKKGHSWESPVYSRAKMKCGCPYCAHQKVIKGENDLLTVAPALCEEWDYDKNKLSPCEYLPNSNEKVWWKCKKCCHSWRTSISHRYGRNSGCPLCSNQVIVKGVNDLETKFPEVAKEWDYEKNPLLPNDVSGGTNKKYWWKCSKCGYEWECVVASRTKRNSNCPACRKFQKQ